MGYILADILTYECTCLHLKKVPIEAPLGVIFKVHGGISARACVVESFGVLFRVDYVIGH